MGVEGEEWWPDPTGSIALELAGGSPWPRRYCSVLRGALVPQSELQSPQSRADTRLSSLGRRRDGKGKRTQEAVPALGLHPGSPAPDSGLAHLSHQETHGSKTQSTRQGPRPTLPLEDLARLPCHPRAKMLEAHRLFRRRHARAASAVPCRQRESPVPSTVLSAAALGTAPDCPNSVPPEDLL